MSAVVERNLQIDTSDADFNNAFNTARAAILLSKLCAVGGTGNILPSLSSNSTSCSQLLRALNSLSAPAEAFTVVSQGCRLRPLLFSSLISDTSVAFIHSNFLL